jgi:hypothetical protein
MATQKQFEQTHNADDVFLRVVTAALIKHLTGRFKWVNRFSHGDVDVSVPFYFSLTGDQQFILDAFTDDVAWKRVQLNTDEIPRGIVSPKSFAAVTAQFSNPNVPVLLNRNNKDNIPERVVVPIRPIPTKITYECKIQLESEVDVFKCWEQLMTMSWVYRYFTYEFSNMPIQAVVSLPENFEDVRLRESDFKTNGRVDMAFDLEVVTYYPAVDWAEAKPAFPVEWVVRAFDKRG